ncbi:MULTISPECIES: DoxX-like family protein [Bacillus cereus group]|uniref:DoxX-like family protein n=1 Tax=Bacillus cereus TaxID=1396 RepID=A0AAE9P904_BACCE|nr:MULTISPECIES: DoxX-like family protein [Bacillus cereus group]AIK31315.1 doxX-like family protein [Bacillus anthracis]AJH88370.1 doxX-like family protein [Bacillus anthracis]KGZ79050.1 membrane protein [Bacillus anthracis]KHA40558.1 membrane protein [Bacillus anthracis]UKX85679.1 DoxX-like family protein [Bacillus anthracis]
MKGKKPIYVSAEMNTTMEKLWEYTQEPHIHTEWDARFTEISYVEKQEGEPQKFLYKTKIGFGLEIAGEGESIGKIRKETGERISSLKFWTDNTLSLIQIGRGYWKYTPCKEHIHFETQYDYDTRYGRIGNVIDFYMFRPLLGWATAWSFDALKLWLEKGLHPGLLIRRTMTYWLVCFLFAFVWMYQGIFPKIIFSHPEEMKMLSAIIGSTGNSIAILKVIGMLEIIFGIIWLFPVPKQKLFILHIFMLIALTIVAGFTNIVSFTEPFNPITLNVLLMGVSIVGYMNSFDLPSAKNCKRKRKG